MAKKNSDIIDEIVVLRSVYGKVGQKYYIQPSRNPDTGDYPEVVKSVDDKDNILLTEAERNSGDVFIKESAIITIEDGTVFDLKNKRQKAEWEAIKYCPLIAPDRWAEDKNGNYLIDGTMGWKNQKPRYGVAELYIEHPGQESKRRVGFKKKLLQAYTFIENDERGVDGRILRAKLLGKKMDHMPDFEVQDFLQQIAEKDPDKIIRLYTGDDITLRMLFIDAKDKGVILFKNKIYSYGDGVVLGATDEAVITFLKEEKNKKLLELIRRDTYPEYDKKN